MESIAILGINTSVKNFGQGQTRVCGVANHGAMSIPSVPKQTKIPDGPTVTFPPILAKTKPIWTLQKPRTPSLHVRTAQIVNALAPTMVSTPRGKKGLVWTMARSVKLTTSTARQSGLGVTGAMYHVLHAVTAGATSARSALLQRNPGQAPICGSITIPAMMTRAWSMTKRRASAKALVTLRWGILCALRAFCQALCVALQPVVRVTARIAAWKLVVLKIVAEAILWQSVPSAARMVHLV